MTMCRLSPITPGELLDEDFLSLSQWLAKTAVRLREERSERHADRH